MRREERKAKHGALSTSKMLLKGPTKSLRQGKLTVSIIPYSIELACMSNWAWLDYLKVVEITLSMASKTLSKFFHC